MTITEHKQIGFVREATVVLLVYGGNAWIVYGLWTLCNWLGYFSLGLSMIIWGVATLISGEQE